MKDVLRLAIVPAYLLACLVFGGSAQGVWANAALQLLAIPIIAWAFLGATAMPKRAAASLGIIAVLTLLVIAIQLIPLPPAIWTALPGRDFVAAGFDLLGVSAPWMPISLNPYATMATALTLLPPLAVLCAMLLTGAYRASWIAMTLLGATFAAVLVGVMQVGSADPYNSPWYFYRWTNHGFATGFFANSNHMAALLVINVPILFAVVRDLRDRAGNARARSATLLLAAAGLLVLLLGIVLNGSLAVLLLGPPVALLSATLLFKRRASYRWPLVGAAGAAGLAMLAVYLSPLHDRIAPGDMTSIAERQQMWSTTARAIPDFMPLGSGLSSLKAVYPRYEDPSSISRTYNSHAHNDYLEIALETGLPGMLLLAAFLLWWGWRTRTIWMSAAADPYAQAATIASGALLLHSIVDYPLRTAALSAVLAALLAIIARPREPERGANDDLWPTRHARI